MVPTLMELNTSPESGSLPSEPSDSTQELGEPGQVMESQFPHP